MAINERQKVHLFIGGSIALVMVFIVAVIAIRYRIDRTEPMSASQAASAIDAAVGEIDAANETDITILPWSALGITAAWEGGDKGHTRCNGDFCWNEEGGKPDVLSIKYAEEIQPYNGVYPWSSGGPTAAWTDSVTKLSTICNGEICWQWEGEEGTEGSWANSGQAALLSTSAWWSRDVPRAEETEPFGVQGYGPDQKWFPWSDGGPTSAWSDPIAQVTTVCNQEICWQWQSALEGKGQWLNDGLPIRFSQSDLWRRKTDPSSESASSVRPYRDRSSIFPWSNGGPTSGWTDLNSSVTTICNKSVCWRWQNAEADGGYWLDEGEPTLLKNLFDSPARSVIPKEVSCEEVRETCQRWKQTSSDEHIRTQYLTGILTRSAERFSFVDEGGVVVPIHINEAMITVSDVQLGVDVILAGVWTDTQAGQQRFLVSEIQSLTKRFANLVHQFDDPSLGEPRSGRQTTPPVTPKKEAWGLSINTASGRYSEEMRFLANYLLSEGIYLTSESAIPEFGAWAQEAFNQQHLVTTGYDWDSGTGESLFSYPLSYDLKEVPSPQEAVLDSWRMLANQAKSGEISQALIYMVGHGIYNEDTKADELGTFTFILQSGLDQGYLTSREMRTALAEFPSGFPLYIVIESCHSGNALLGHNALYSAVSDSIGKLDAELHVMVSALPEDLAAASIDTFTVNLSDRLNKQGATLESAAIEMVDHYLYNASSAWTAPLYRVNDDYPYGEILKDWSSTEYSRLRLSQGYGEHAFWGSMRWAGDLTGSGEKVLRVGNPTDYSVSYELSYVDNRDQVIEASIMDINPSDYQDVLIDADRLSRLDYIQINKLNTDSLGDLLLQNAKSDECGEITIASDVLYQMITVIGNNDALSDKITVAFDVAQACAEDGHVFVSTYNDRIFSNRELARYQLPKTGGRIQPEMWFGKDSNSGGVEDPYLLEVFDQRGKLRVRRDDVFSNMTAQSMYSSKLSVYPSYPDLPDRVISRLLNFETRKETYRIVNRESTPITISSLDWVDDVTTIAIDESASTCVHLPLATGESCEIVVKLLAEGPYEGYRDTLLLATEGDPDYFSIVIEHHLDYKTYNTTRTYEPIIGLPFHLDFIVDGNVAFSESGSPKFWHWETNYVMKPVQLIVETGTETTECSIPLGSSESTCYLPQFMDKGMTRVRMIAQTRKAGRFAAGVSDLERWIGKTQFADVADRSPVNQTWKQEGYDFTVNSPTALLPQSSPSSPRNVMVGSQVVIKHEEMKEFGLKVTHDSGKAVLTDDDTLNQRSTFSVFDTGEVILELTETESGTVADIPLSVVSGLGYGDTEQIIFDQNERFESAFREYDVFLYSQSAQNDASAEDVGLRLYRPDWAKGDKESFFITYDQDVWSFSDPSLYAIRPKPTKEPCSIFDEFGYLYCDIAVPDDLSTEFSLGGIAFFVTPKAEKSLLFEFELRTQRIDARDVLPIVAYLGDRELIGYLNDRYSLKAPFNPDGTLVVGDPILIDVYPNSAFGPFKYTGTKPDGEQIGGSGSTIAVNKTGFLRIPFMADQLGDWSLDLAGDSYTIKVVSEQQVGRDKATPTTAHDESIKIVAKGTPADDDANGKLEPVNYPLMIVAVDDESIGQVYVKSEDYVEYSFPYSGKITPERVKVMFVNDYYRPEQSMDRNLVVDKVVINGDVLESEDAFSEGVYSNGSCSPGFKASELLACNGYLRFVDGDGLAKSVVRDWLKAFTDLRSSDQVAISLGQKIQEGSLTLKQFLVAISSSNSFKRNGMSDADFVQALYQELLHRAPDEAGFENWRHLLEVDRLTRKQVMAAFVESDEFDSYYAEYDFTKEWGSND